MKNDRMQKAEYLFREIGNIHDRWVTEAITYQKPRARLLRPLTVAASIAVAASLLVGVFAANWNQIETLLGNLPFRESGSEEELKFTSTESLLLHCREDANASYTVVSSVSELDFFSERVHVVWQYENDSAVYVSRALTDDERDRLTYQMKYADRFDESAAQPACRVWILYGDGSVASPYLQSSIGNVGVGELFDYNVEVIPNADFNTCLSDILY